MTGHLKVDFDDLVAFAGAYINYYQIGQCYPATDFNHDGKIDFSDLVFFADSYVAYYAGPTPFMNKELTMTLKIDKTAFTQGEPVTFVQSINNVSNKP